MASTEQPDVRSEGKARQKDEIKIPKITSAALLQNMYGTRPGND